MGDGGFPFEMVNGVPVVAAPEEIDITSAPALRSAGPLTSRVVTVRPSARSRAALAEPSPLAPPVTRAVRDMTATLPG